MCGIVGFISTEEFSGTRDRQDFLEQSLIINTLRGEDSTGVLYGHALDKRAGFLRNVVDGYQFVSSPDYVQSVHNKVSTLSFAVGHNRAATMGTVSVGTAHPFVVGNDGEQLGGVHNGTVRGGMTGLPIPLAKSGVDVDSHCIMKNLHHVDPGEALTKVVSKIAGAYALVWHDQRDGSLNFARNSERSFHLAQSYSQETLFFASEHGQLAWLNDRIGLGLYEVLYLEPGKALKFTKDNGLDPEVTEFDIAPKYVAPARSNYGGGGWTYASYGNYGAAGSVGAKQTEAFNKVRVGGMYREVPQKHQAELLEHGLAVEDRLQVLPVGQQPVGTLKNEYERRYVQAYNDSLGLTVMVHRVPRLSLRQAWDKRWTVRPIGVKYLSRDRKEKMILAELVADFPAEEQFTLLDRPSSTPSTPAFEAPGDGWPGPEGTSLGTDDWLTATDGGCAVCTRDLTVMDAPDIEWDGDDPICPDCADMDNRAITALEESWYGRGGML